VELKRRDAVRASENKKRKKFTGEKKIVSEVPTGRALNSSVQGRVSRR